MTDSVCPYVVMPAFLTLIALGPAWADAVPQDRADRVWAAGYAAAAAHFCPGLQVDEVAVANTHGAATVIDPKMGPRLDDAMLPVFKSGGLTGESGFRQHAGFCSDPPSFAPRASAWIRRYLNVRPRQR